MTLSLVIGGTILFLLIAFPIGILTALRPRSLMDKGMMALILVGVSAHPVWIGLMLSYFFGVRLDAFPVADYCRFNFDESTPERCGGPTDWAYHLVLPWITFALLFAALYARMIRANMLEQMDEDYVRTARAKGAGNSRVMRRHVLPNALLAGGDDARHGRRARIHRRPLHRDRVPVAGVGERALPGAREL